MNFTIRKYSPADFNRVYEIVHKTIDEIYPAYYPHEAVIFFHNRHSSEKMKEDIPRGTTLVAETNGEITATASIVNDEFKRMFVLPDRQSNGLGKKLLLELEKIAFANGHKTAKLDSSLGAYDFYLKNGYWLSKYHILNLNNGHHLCYFRMKKHLFAENNFTISYNNKIFMSVNNSPNGEVSDKTLFHYHQNGNLVWADYSGGHIVRGYLIGTCNIKGLLKFNYMHVNTDGNTRTGYCESVPEIMIDGRLKLSEKWQWTNGDLSKGESVIEEISFQKNSE